MITVEPLRTVQLKFSPLIDWVIMGIWGTIQQRSPPVFTAGGPCEQTWHGQGCPLFDVVHRALSLPTTASPILQGALKNGFGEAVVACDMPEPCRFPSLDSCLKRFLWTHKEVDLALPPVVGLVLQVGEVEKFPPAHGFESLDPFLWVSKQGPCFTSWWQTTLFFRLKKIEEKKVPSCFPVNEPLFKDYPSFKTTLLWPDF